MNDLELTYQQSANHVHALLRALGHRQTVSPAILRAALEIIEPGPRDQLIAQAKEFFRSRAVLIPEGLEDLPSAWLSKLPAALWSTRKPHWTHLPYMMRKIGFADGVVCLSFPQELPNPDQRVTAWDRVRIELNLRLYPNLWTPISTDLEKRIWTSRPDLRNELFHLPV